MLRALAFTLAMASSQAWAQGDSTGVQQRTLVEREGETLQFYGYITEAAVERALRLLPGSTTLEINSPGGNNLAAIKLADAVAKGGVDVVVNGNCYSACAHYIFLAGKQKIVSVGSLLLFHGTPFAWERVLRERPKALTAEQTAAVKRDIRAATDLYRRLGVRTELLRCVDHALGVPKIDLTALPQAKPGESPPALYGPATFAGMAPGMLARFGVKGVTYYWYPILDQRLRTAKLPRLGGAALAWIDAPESCGN